VNKHGGGRNARWFAPERIRELAPSQRGDRAVNTFVSLEGLGRIPFSNIRRPKPLMEVSEAPPAARVRRGAATPAFICIWMLTGIASRHLSLRSTAAIAHDPYFVVLRPHVSHLATCSTMQGADGDEAAEEAKAGDRKARRPLEQEPALAARIMIEDCLALLLDVQDIDRLFAASPSAPPSFSH